ncbi:MAG: hypothetical protein ACREAA_05785 [Candidatus Polarisedimenticolia bacterium]
MTRVNWQRFMIGALIATVIDFLSDGFLHEVLVRRQWEDVYARLGVPEPQHSATGLFYFVLFDLGRGFVAMFLYVMMRARYGPGPRTAIWAGIISWIALSLTGPAQFIPLGFFSVSLWLIAAAYQLVTSILATLAGAATYKE